MARQYDLVVIGTGTAATVAATRMAGEGWSVAVTDFRPYGGTCALRGCDPKKMLRSGAAVRSVVRRMQDKGVEGQVCIDWQELMAFAQSFTGPIPSRKESRFHNLGIDTYHGAARFTGRNTLEVANELLEAKYILLASGAEPIRLNIPGEEHVVTNEEFLNLETLPGRIVLVGGGYIAAEFAHIAAHAGAGITVLQRGQQLLKHFESELVSWLMEAFERAGVSVRTETSVKAIEKTAGGFRVEAESTEGQCSFEADLVVHAAGRRPDFSGMDLDRGGVALEKGRLQLNEYLQSVSNPSVYAAGDAAQMGPPLTPVASYDAKVVAANLLHGNHRTPDYAGVPSVAFTIPPIASVGLTEEAARQAGRRIRVKSQRASDWFHALQAAEPVYGFKVLVEEGSERVLGAHLVGHHADEVINVFALAIRHQLTVDQLKDTMFA